MKYYYTSDGRKILRADLPRASEAEQVDIMKTWFRERYEDPAERTPYESAEGGYIWIWGGPHEARDVLGDEFSAVVSEDLIETLVNALDDECPEWAPTAFLDEDDFVTDIAAISDYRANFLDGLRAIRELTETPVTGESARCLFRLLYVNVITALETFLSDAFTNTVLDDPRLLRKFIENTPDFKKQKVSLAEVFDAVDNANRKAKEYLRQITWHRLDQVKRMYRDVLGIEFPEAEPLRQAVRIRHHLVHRNGKTRDGKAIPIEKGEVLTMARRVEEFVTFVDDELEAREMLSTNHVIFEER